jgi:hypothetical protein
VTSQGKLNQALSALEAATREDLLREWRRLYKSAPLRYGSRDFLVRAISYALQERELGGLPASVRRALLAMATGNPASLRTPRLKIKPGTRLLREWRGTTHEVLVIDQGFVWQGATYRSLSAIAVAITGAKWNGPRFFGLTSRGGTNARA